MTIEDELSLLDRYQITPTELLFIKMLFLSRESDAKPVVAQYFNLDMEVKGDILLNLQSLQKKQIITKEYKLPVKGGKFKPYEVIFNKNFEKVFYKASYILGKELFDVYPLSTVINGVEYKLRRVSKKFDTLEQAFFHYAKYINWNAEKHKRILNLIEEGKRSGYQFSTLDSFIVDNDWVNLEALNDSGQLISNVRML
jgi:hypothetical protein